MKLKDITKFGLLTCFFMCSFSCSDNNNDDELNNEGVVNTSNVFKGGLPTRIDNMILHYDGQNRLKEIIQLEDDIFIYNSRTITFGYSDNGRYVKMSEDDNDNYEITLNKAGFAEFFISDDDDDPYTMRLSYNEDGQIESIDDDGAINMLTYNNGDLVKYEKKYDDGSWREGVITYTSYENKGCVFPIDYILPSGWRGDGPEYLYYAGLLGKPTKHLPEKVIYYHCDENGREWEDTTTFTWQFDNNSYPIKLTLKVDNGDEYDGVTETTFDYAW